MPITTTVLHTSKLAKVTVQLSTWKMACYPKDAAFTLKTYLMKPYPGVNPSAEEKVFNYRLSPARRIVETTFGILISRFRIFEKAIPTNLDRVDAIVLAACALHNWLRKKSKSYITSTCVDREDEDKKLVAGSWRNEITALKSFSVQGSKKRDKYNNFFMSAGSVPWQVSRIQ